MNEIVLRGPLARVRGVIGRYPAPDERYVLEFDRVAPRGIHMVGVRRPLLVKWYASDELVLEKVLPPWIGFGLARAVRVTEEAAGRGLSLL